MIFAFCHVEPHDAKTSREILKFDDFFEFVFGFVHLREVSRVEREATLYLLLLGRLRI